MSNAADFSGALYVELSGADVLRERLGETETAYAMDRCLKRMERVAEGLGGDIVLFTGHSLVVLFKATEAACHAAIEMQQRVSDLPPVSGVKLSARIGLAATPETATSLVEFSSPGEIVADSALREALTTLLSDKIRPFEVPQGSGDGSAPKSAVGVPWQGVDVKELARASRQRADARLCVRFHGKAFLLDERTQSLSVGRDAASDLVVGDRKASRKHARIVRRPEGFFLVDQSTNGTFLAFEGMPEQLIRDTEVGLQASGRFGCGHSTTAPDTEVIAFELL